MAHEDLGDGIVAIDTLFQRPSFDASHLIVERGRAAFVDVGTSYSVPHLLSTLDRLDLRPDAVDYVILTHVHLDHAGGAGQLMQQLPRAQLVVHPRGARHMIDPSMLWAGASAVYGEHTMHATYGELLPVPAERVTQAPDGFRLELAGRPLLFLDTPGHARHHACIWDEVSRGLFTGDTFGLAYRELASDRGAFILPTTTPVQFEPEPLKASIERLVGLGPRSAYLTHYSRVGDVERLAATLRSRVDELVALARAEHGKPGRGARLRSGVRELFLGWARDHGTPLPDASVAELLALDVELNAQGLEVWLDRGRG